MLARLLDGVGCLGDLRPLDACPRKQPWGKPTPPPEDVAYNQAFSQRRIIVEAIINRLRRYQALTQSDRQHRRDHTARICAVTGLVNRQLAARMPMH